MKMFILAMSLLAAALSHAGSQDDWGVWLPVQGGDNDSFYYTSVDVEQYGEQTSFVLYANQRQNCKVQAAFMTWVETDDFDSKIGSEAHRVEIKVDDNDLWYYEDLEYTMVIDDGLLQLRMPMGVNDRFISELVVGKKLMMRTMFKKENGWIGTQRFPLEKSRTRINQLMRACNNHVDDEWDADDWERNISENEWDS